MKSFICVKKIHKQAIKNLDIFNYVIVYYDEPTKELRIAMPDYNEEYIDNSSLYSAMNGNIGFFRKIKNLSLCENSIGLFTDGNKITNVVGYFSRDGLIDSLDVSGEVLRKRLK